MRNQWYIACEAGALARKPLSRKILGEPLVLFRDAAGRASALADRCPHRIGDFGIRRDVKLGIQSVGQSRVISRDGRANGNQRMV